MRARPVTTIAIMLSLLSLPGTAASVHADWRPSPGPMQWTDCLREIGVATGQFGMPPEVVEDNESLHVVRFMTEKGVVVIACVAEHARPVVARRG